MGKFAMHEEMRKPKALAKSQLTMRIMTNKQYASD